VRAVIWNRAYRLAGVDDEAEMGERTSSGMLPGMVEASYEKAAGDHEKALANWHAACEALRPAFARVGAVAQLATVFGGLVYDVSVAPGAGGTLPGFVEQLVLAEEAAAE